MTGEAWMPAVVVGFSLASQLLPWGHNPVGAGLPARVVNDDAGSLDARGGCGFFAGKPAPTMGHNPVGAGLPAMVVNDDAGSLDARGGCGFFAGKPAPTVGA